MNDLRTTFFIAYKSITRGRKSTLALMIFILSLSFINMMFISGVLSGLWQSEIDTAINFLTSHVTISPQQEPSMKEFIPNQKELRARLKTIPGIVATVRHYLLAGSLSYDKDKNGQLKSVSGIIIGVDPKEESNVLIVQKTMIAGENLTDMDTDKILLSSAVAGGYGSIEHSTTDLSGARVGDKIQVTYFNGILRTYTVKGIYNDVVGINQTFITAKEAESILSISNSASQVLVKADLSRMPIEQYQDKIQTMVPNLTIENYTSFLNTVASFQDALNLISIIVSAISVLVASVTIFVLIYVNAMSRQRQIGILKAIGIRQSIIVNAYILQSLFYTLCGVLIGSITVFAFLQPLLLIYPIPIIENVMNLTLAYSTTGVIIAIISFAVAGFLAGRIPAVIVARKNILTAIWG